LLSEEEQMSEALVRIFENVVLTEEKSLQAGYFKDLSIAEMHTLTAIGPYDARTMTNTAEDLGITTGTLTVAIDRLVKKGYVHRERDKRDKRIVRISLTHTGKLACRMNSKFHRVLAKHILAGYNADDRKHLLDLVNEVDQYVEQQLRRYDSSKNVRATATQVAKDTTKEKKQDG
jgi:DNA-binding MarR family transcriptional regulator